MKRRVGSVGSSADRITGGGVRISPPRHRMRREEGQRDLSRRVWVNGLNSQCKVVRDLKIY